MFFFLYFSPELQAVKALWRNFLFEQCGIQFANYLWDSLVRIWLKKALVKDLLRNVLQVGNNSGSCQELSDLIYPDLEAAKPTRIVFIHHVIR